MTRPPLGAATVAIGLALQGAMSNLAAGVMLMIFRPYKIGDFVEGGGHFGNVEDITMFTTDMQTFDNQKIIIPNGKIWGEKIINHSHHPVRGVEMKFNIAYDVDIEKAAIKESKRFLSVVTPGVSRPRSGSRLPRRVHEARDCADTSRVSS